MGLVDVHAHLCDPAFSNDLDAVLERARSAGVEAVVAVGESLDDARRNLELAELHPATIRPAAGLYPTRLDLAEAESVVSLVLRHRSALAAIGEVGLDHHAVRDGEARELQAAIFERFVALSIETGLPLNVHSRSASRAAVSRLLARSPRRVLLHAFDGKVGTALPAVEAGFFFSIPPSIVRSEQKRKLVRRLPLSCLLLETDSPVLGPEPGARNEPANLAISLRAVAEIKGIREEEVAEAVEANQRRLFEV